MKKLLCALLCGLLALSTSACTPDGSVYDTTNDTVRVWEYTYPSETTTTSPSTATTTTITTTTTAATSITHTTRTTVRATRRTAKKAATRAAVENDSNNESAQEPQSDTVLLSGCTEISLYGWPYRGRDRAKAGAPTGCREAPAGTRRQAAGA